jgi:uncharacterized membrane protein YedE/YeeE
MNYLAQFIAGLIFGTGLVVSGMIFPDKVLNFLDIAGQWDPSLAFVMGGAVTVTFIGFRYAFSRTKPVFAARFLIPTKQSIDRRLLSGAALFGIGWGLSGLCPGPAISSLAMANPRVLIMLVAMIIGMTFARYLARTNSTHQ